MTSPWAKDWLTKRAEGEQVPLQDADRDRPGPPDLSKEPPVAPAAPEQQVEPPKPIPTNELRNTLETASKAAIDSGLAIEKGVANLLKVDAYSATNPKEAQMLSKVKEFVEVGKKIHEMAESFAESLNEFKDSLTEPGPGSWTE